MDKSRFISESLKKIVDRQIAPIRKTNKRRIKEICESGNFGEIDVIMEEVLYKVAEAITEWESKSYKELNGFTPVQYIESLHTTQDIISLVTLLEDISMGVMPSGIASRIKRFDEAFFEVIQHALESMQLGENKCFTHEQRAIIRIAEIIALPEFLNGLAGIIKQLDEDQSDEATITRVFDLVRALGKAAISQLTELIESNKRKGKIYDHAILAIGGIASENKSEQIFKLLKDCFRSSDVKLLESAALAAYGDGRAIPAIRGYVERHLEDLSPWEYYRFRSNVTDLGGDMSDLDEYFDDYDDDYDDDNDFDDLTDADENG